MPDDIGKPSLRQMVAQYVRMSTEHQQYSTENQSVAILQYAQVHDMDIVRTYADHGKSGLDLAGRTGLRQLLTDVHAGDIDFTAVLVYDVSRWGRFQNPDQGASYEYSLTAAKIPVHYCAEQFKNDGSLSSALLKTVKRGMAGEYSRELSVKVWAGQKRLIELGFRQGGMAGYGLSRHLIDQNRAFKQTLARGERKSLQTDRVILVPSSEQEVEVVRNIYKLFIEGELNEREIANLLNFRAIPWESGRLWTRGIVHQILTNPKYVGCNVFNRTSQKLKGKIVNNPRNEWVVKEAAFEPLVSDAQFDQAQTIIAARHMHLDNEQLLTLLRSLREKAGFLSGFLIDETDGMPSSSLFARRFGGLPRAYSLVGWTPARDYRFIEVNRMIRRQHQGLIQTICDRLIQNGATVQRDDKTDLLTINQEYSTSLVLGQCRATSSGGHRWVVRFDTGLAPDITIAARLAPGNESILDYYLLPSLAELGSQLRLREENPLPLEVYRFRDLDFFSEIARRTRIEQIA
jgi:DNA invertase Pin-like site-specific DNA recombinase